MGKKKKKIAIFSCMMGGYDIPTDNFEMRKGYDQHQKLELNPSEKKENRE